MARKPKKEQEEIFCPKCNSLDFIFIAKKNYEEGGVRSCLDCDYEQKTTYVWKQ